MIRVSDHFMLRYLERVQGIDVPALREALAERLARAAEAAEALDAEEYAIRLDGWLYRVRGGTVTTIVPDHSASRRARAIRRRRARAAG
ncbi:hypothetical protein ACFQ1E_08085 [Sphingomonas canadensis]|uniref:DUF4258 domain-containing protein n=1 Tax=Sphingomonas canadensis TaxID=1219257 RepID=A0ABW3H447_9SPHN|nr:hypothetical protein [Sphingomonas canadensis]MCW3835995.1 hypothetical protein [Sphingomonas canadensis]